MKKVIVNAIPLTNVSTGISRYLRCLYGEIEERFSHEFEIYYFDGVNAKREMPSGPENLGQWSLLADIFWKLPPRVAYWVRRAVQFRRERAFRSVANGFDLYHEAGFFPFIPPQGVRTVFTIHDMSIHRYPQHHPRERVLFVKRFLAERTALAKRVLTVSDFSKKEIIDVLGIDAQRITVTHLAPAPVFEPRSQAGLREELEQRFQLPSRYFLFVGSGDPRKNVSIIPKAIERGAVDIPLVCVGWSGWSGGESASDIISLGYLSDEDLAAVYSGATALVFPSIYEGFGLPVAEAQACGCPVVTTQKASLAEVGGNAALYVERPDDIDELARLLKRLAEEPSLCDELSRKGLEHAQQFSWAKTADLTCDAFRQALEDA